MCSYDASVTELSLLLVVFWVIMGRIIWFLDQQMGTAAGDW